MGEPTFLPQLSDEDLPTAILSIHWEVERNLEIKIGSIQIPYHFKKGQITRNHRSREERLDTNFQCVSCGSMVTGKEVTVLTSSYCSKNYFF